MKALVSLPGVSHATCETSAIRSLKSQRASCLHTIKLLLADLHDVFFARVASPRDTSVCLTTNREQQPNLRDRLERAAQPR